MSADCLFCKIAAKKIPSKIVYEVSDLFAFEDIGPQAPTHILICPRKHFVSLDEAGREEPTGVRKPVVISAPHARQKNIVVRVPNGVERAGPAGPIPAYFCFDIFSRATRS